MNNPNFNYSGFLDQAEARAKQLRPGERERCIEIITAHRANFVTGDKEIVEANKKEYAALVQRARDGDHTAKFEVTKIRTTRVDNFIRAMSNVMRFFEVITLAPNEAPYIENTSRQETTVGYIGQDGQARATQPIKYQEQVQLPLYIVSSSDFEYFLKDMYRGEIADESKLLVDLGWDLDRVIEKLTFPYLQQQIGPFNLTGTRASQAYVAHSAINVNNLPVSNLLIPPGQTLNSLFRKECFDAVLAYIASFGDALPGGPMEVVSIFVPSSEIMGFLQQVSLTTFSNSLTEQIFSTGFIFDYGGKKWNLIPDVTLDPNLGLAYVLTNKPVGQFFVKPFMDDVIEDLSVDLRKQNKGRMSMSKAVGWGLPATYKLNIVAIQYHLNRYLPGGSSSSSSSH